jgi:hypothetical protein
MAPIFNTSHDAVLPAGSAMLFAPFLKSVLLHFS